jgi:hypothetical protein
MGHIGLICEQQLVLELVRLLSCGQLDVSFCLKYLLVQVPCQA